MSVVFRTAAPAGLLAITLCVPSAAAQPTVDVVHAFAGLPGRPASRLLQASNGLFYGTLLEGGPEAAGIVFASWVSPTGSLVVIPLHVFEGADGRAPAAGLVEGDDGTFYGTTFAGGAAGQGTIFSITAQGQFTLLHSFSGADGSAPFAGLIAGPDGSLYGTTTAGGSANSGTVFRIDGTGTLSTIHSFTGSDGANPYAGLMLASDENFYGTTFAGGTNDGGTVFRLTSGGALETLHHFSAPFNHLSRPYAGLIQGADGALYGTTMGFGGSVFRVTTAGVLTELHSFYGPEDGQPFGGVIQGDDGALYGATLTNFFGPGSVFRLTTGGQFSTLHVFGAEEGSYPFGGLVQARDGQLYGLTTLGGAASNGTAYRLTTGGAFATLASFTGLPGDGPADGVIRASDGNFYGTTQNGGLANRGTVFRLTPGGQITTLRMFTGGDGANPTGLMQASNGLLYGTTSNGGAFERGTIFVMTTTGLFLNLHHFAETEFGLGATRGRLVEAADGALYGIDEGAFFLGPGVIFRITPSGVFTEIARVPDAKGPLVEGADGNLYGTTAPIPFLSSGAVGTVFRLSLAGDLTTLAEFPCSFPSGPCPSGGGPVGLVAGSDGAIYGVTSFGFSPTFQPTLFKVDESGLTEVARFEDGFPTSSLIQAADGRLYGSAQSGSGQPSDTSFYVYSASTEGGLAIVHTFSPAEGSAVNGRLLETEPGVFHGTARTGGPRNHGVVFRLTVPAGP